MSSSDENIIDLNTKSTRRQKSSRGKTKTKKVMPLVPEEVLSEASEVGDTLRKLKKHRMDVQNSDSSDIQDDDDRNKTVKCRHANLKSEKNQWEGKKKLKQSSRQLTSDSEPLVIKRKKVEERSSSHGYDEDDDEYTAIKEELSHMSFEELQQLRDRLGVKVYNQVIRRGRDETRRPFSAKRKFTRENKNRPMEVSSKRHISKYREVIPVKKKKVMRDPRFDDMSGNFNEAIFRSSYAFVDDIKKKEKEKLTKELKKTKNSKKKQELKFLINRMNQQELSALQRQRKKSLEKEWKKKETSLVQEGKNPFFLKKGDLRKLELAERFKELKKTGKLDKYLGKKRKKNASKEKKKLPN